MPIFGMQMCYIMCSLAVTQSNIGGIVVRQVGCWLMMRNAGVSPCRDVAA